MNQCYVKSMSIIGVLSLSLFTPFVVDASEPTVLKLAHVSTLDGPMGIGGERFAANLKQVSGGKMTVKVFPKGSLGGTREIWAQMQGGTVDMQVVDLPAITILKPAKAMKVAVMPYMFESQAHFRKFAESDLLAGLANEITEKTGIRYLGIVQDRAPRLISTTGKVVKSVDDVAGLKIRIPGDPVFVKLFKSWGAIPVLTRHSELFMALKSGMAEGEDRGITTLAIAPIRELIKTVSPINWNRSGVAAWITESRWKAFSDQERAWVSEAIAISERDSKKDYEQNLVEARKKLLDMGMVFQEIDVESFKAASKDFHKEFKDVWPEGTVEAIKAMAE